ncbi:MAG: GNAT family N-acetyltransferase [Pyrinomonadaceae bacterium]
MDCFKLIWREGSIKGYGAVYPLDETHFRLNLMVHSDCRRIGIGTALFQLVEEESRRLGCSSLQARTLEGEGGGLEFAIRNGFQEVHRMRGMILRAADFQFENWVGLGESLRGQDFSVTDLAEEYRSGERSIEKLIELHRAAVEDWVRIDPTVRPNTGTGHLTAFFTGAKKPERVSIIKLGERYAGYTCSDPENLIGTAVHPEFRNRGVATYLKACDLKKSFDRGAQEIESATANPAMIRVNQKLGYRPNGLCEIRLFKSL